MLALCLVLVLLIPLAGRQLMMVVPEIAHTEPGYTDLSRWDFRQQGPVRLSGEWEFYQGQLLAPEDFGLFRERSGGKADRTGTYKPGVWNRYMDAPGSPGEGYGTYRMRMKLPDAEQTAVYGIHTSNFRTSNRIYLNGQLVGASGSPAASKHSAEAANVPYVGFASVRGTDAEIIIHVANYKYATGGMVYPVTFGDFPSVMRSRETALLVDYFSMAGFLIPALFVLLLYRFRKQEKSLLYLGLFCLSGLLYVLTHGEKLLGAALPGMGYEWFTNLQQISSILSYCFLYQYVSASQPYAAPVLNRAVQWAAAAQVAAVAVLPVAVFSRYGVVFALLGAATLACVLYLMARGRRDGRETGFLLLISVSSMIAVIAVCMMNVIGKLQDPFLIPYELLLFVLAQALQLAKQFAKAFREVEQLSGRLLVMDRLKDEFMERTSDELRTPLHAILTISQSLLEGAAGSLNVEQSRNIRTIASTGKRLSSFVHDMQDFARLKNANVVLQRQAVDLPTVAQSVLEVLGHVAGSKNIRITQNWPPSLPLLDTDEERLRQILFNLLGNAVQYTEQGEVGISASVDNGFVTVMIRDTGIGMNQEQVESLFEDFDSLRSVRYHDRRGTGLGLSIARKLLELNGGWIRVESEPGLGTVFCFSLPKAAEEQPVERAAPPPARSVPPAEGAAAVSSEPAQEQSGRRERPRILIVDDDPVNLQVLTQLLSREFGSIIAVDNGEEAVGIMMRSPGIDLVITDWVMPGMSGLDLCRSIRCRYLMSELPVLMLTGISVSDEDISVCFDAGVNDILGKPVQPEALKARVRTLLELRKSVQQTVRTEMAFLQAQIKPHFLYNALNTIIATCPVDPDQATELLILLSEYLRSSFDFQNRDQLSSLKKELALVDAYLTLEKARFDDRLNVVFDIAVSEDVLIPPLSIQPIVENAVGHGIMKKAEGGTVRITVREGGPFLTVRVEDDGAGIPPERLHTILDGQGRTKSVGLTNIHRRLFALFGEGLHIESVPNRGTSVRFKVPKEV